MGEKRDPETGEAMPANRGLAPRPLIGQAFGFCLSHLVSPVII